MISLKEQIEWMEKTNAAYAATCGECHHEIAVNEAILRTLKSLQKNKVVWNFGTPTKRGVYPVKCDGPNPNKGFRYWNGEYWSILASSYAQALSLNGDTNVRRAQIKRPILYATKGR